jgi:ABC-type antimicrobial peptide transport system permease subunit
MRLASIGIAAGIFIGAGVALAVQELLYGVKPLDPVTFGSVIAIVAAVALLACYIPARRASGVDPAVALRCE